MTHQNRLGGAVVALGLVALLALPSAAVANLLTNPSLEETYVDDYGNIVPTGWGLWQSAWEGWGSPSWITAHLDDGTARTGLNAFEVGAGDFATGGYALLIQDLFIDIAPGEEFTLSAYARDALVNGSTTGAGLKIEFWQDGGSSPIDSLEVLTVIPNDGEYHYLEMSYAAPADGSADYMKAILLATEWSSGQSAYLFDDAVLTPEPSTLGLFGLVGLAMIRRRR